MDEDEEDEEVEVFDWLSEKDIAEDDDGGKNDGKEEGTDADGSSSSSTCSPSPAEGGEGLSADAITIASDTS
jgi:hypothetical protein